MQNQLCRVCDEPAAGFHFGAFTCEGCKSFFGRTCNNQSVIQECKNNYRCVINKKNRTACKACRLRKCLMVGMSKSGSRYGRRSNWFKIHCLMQQATGASSRSIHHSPTPLTPLATSQPQPPPEEPPATSPPPAAGLWRPLDTPSPRPSSVVQHRKSSPPPPPPPQPATTSTQDLSGFILNQHLKNHLAASTEAALTAAHNSFATSSPPPPRFPYSPLLAGHTTSSFLPPTFNLPALAALPIHKQALLSPLLASGHMLAASLAAAAAAAAAANAAKTEHEHATLGEPKDTKPPPNAIDLTKTPDEENSRSSSNSSVDSMGSQIIPNLSDTDEEEAHEESDKKEEGENKEEDLTSKKKEETPLDLTCV